MEVLYAEVFDALQSIEEKSSFRHANLDEDGFHNHITDLKALLKKERNEYKVSQLGVNFFGSYLSSNILFKL